MAVQVAPSDCAPLQSVEAIPEPIVGAGHFCSVQVPVPANSPLASQVKVLDPDTVNPSSQSKLQVSPYSYGPDPEPQSSFPFAGPAPAAHVTGSHFTSEVHATSAPSSADFGAQVSCPRTLR